MANKNWVLPSNSPSEIKAAGRTIRHADPDSADWVSALVVVDNWRAAHAYPLQVFYMNLRSLARRTKVYVAQRLKRLASIVPKLQSEVVKNLWAMQDLGGCRLVAANLEQVYLLEEKLRKSRIRHVLQKTNDYIKSPKTSGYRSLHVVYRFHSDKHKDFNNNILIEIQFRTRLQHMWATAVEAMGLYMGCRLKSGEGDDAVNRFFALTSSLIALTENCPIVPGTSSDRGQLVKEIIELNRRFSFLEKLSAMVVAVDVKKEELKNRGGYYLLFLDLETRRLQIRPFQAREYEKANEVCKRLENDVQARSKRRDVVLVRVKSMKELRKAYPNYFADVRDFIRFVELAISL